MIGNVILHTTDLVQFRQEGKIKSYLFSGFSTNVSYNSTVTHLALQSILFSCSCEQDTYCRVLPVGVWLIIVEQVLTGMLQQPAHHANNSGVVRLRVRVTV